MQQMMAKAGGAPPEQGMSAMNPMAAMMGTLVALVVNSMHALSILVILKRRELPRSARHGEHGG